MTTSGELAALEKRLQAVEDPTAFLAMLFAHAPVGFAVWASDGRVLLTNPAFRELFGSEPPAGYNVLADEITAASGVLDRIRRAFAGETTYLPTFWYDPHGSQPASVTAGRRVAISMTVFPLRDREGRIQYVAATYRDDTTMMLSREQLESERSQLQATVAQLERRTAEQQRTAQELANNERRFRALAENSFWLFNFIDRDGRFSFVSPSVTEVTGFTPEEMVGKPARDFVHPDEIDPNKPFPTTDRPLGSRLLINRRVRHKDGSWRWVEGYSTNLLDDPAVRAVVFNYHDVTKRKEAEDEARDFRAKLEAVQSETLRLNEALEERVRTRTAELEVALGELESFSYSVSHDLRAPLRSLDGFSQILSEDFAAQLGPEGQAYLARMRAASTRMSQLIDDLLLLSRVTRTEIVRRPVDLTRQAHAIAAELRKTAPERNVTFEIAPDLTVNADAGLMRTVLENLLGNAWKYTSKHPSARIEFGEREMDGRRVFFVLDDGAGFEMEYASKLFGAFQRLHSSRDFDGTGIGLATVQRIIHRHGGRVWAEGKVESGATFYFTLP
jgi:PAS domain S-box-containing protein